MDEMASRTTKLAYVRDEADARRCWDVFKELRPHLNEAEFLKRWQRQSAEGYQIVYLESDSSIVAAAGFRILHTMAWGKIIYLDDLVARASEHGCGLGTQLLQWLQETARQNNCDAIHLDTGYHRLAAHRSYLRNGFHLSCHHLAWSTGAP